MRHASWGKKRLKILDGLGKTEGADGLGKDGGRETSWEKAGGARRVGNEGRGI